MLIVASIVLCVVLNSKLHNNRIVHSCAYQMVQFPDLAAQSPDFVVIQLSLNV